MIFEEEFSIEGKEIMLRAEINEGYPAGSRPAMEPSQHLEAEADVMTTNK
tara:strand:+ start:2934 stop:3083 length:150 start_codon:yes stop_codon:yes gene_type:complete